MGESFLSAIASLESSGTTRPKLSTCVILSQPVWNVSEGAVIRVQTSIAFHKEIEEAVGVLRGKGVVAFPTDTLYGLGADAFSAEAVGRVFEIKGRHSDRPLPVLLGSIQELEDVTTDIPDLAWELVDHFWPGPLTLILKKSPQIPHVVTGGRDSVGVRMPNHKVPLSLVWELGRPITGTSANPSGGPDPITAEDVRRLLGNGVDYVMDGGSATAGSPSTVVDLTKSTPRLVRPGAIACRDLEAICSLPLELS